MNGIEKLIERIRADAQAEIDATLAQAGAQADSIAAEYARRAKSLADEIISKGSQNARQQEQRLAAAADTLRRKKLLAVRQELVGSAFDLALDRLCSMDDREYTAILVRLALNAASSGRGQMIFSPTDRGRVGSAVVTAVNRARPDGILTLSDQTRPIRGGFILRDGAVEVNCSFEALIRFQRDRLAADAARTLFT